MDYDSRPGESSLSVALEDIELGMPDKVTLASTLLQSSPETY